VVKSVTIPRKGPGVGRVSPAPRPHSHLHRGPWCSRTHAHSHTHTDVHAAPHPPPVRSGFGWFALPCVFGLTVHRRCSWSLTTSLRRSRHPRP
jgi:hypothetical protein